MVAMETRTKSQPPRPEMPRGLMGTAPTRDGVFFTAVKTTGIFCRPGCPARTPLPQNVEFFGTAREAMSAGYRPCKRCRPLEARGDRPDGITLDFIESPVGPLVAGTDERGVCLLEFSDPRRIEAQVEILRRRLGRPLVPGRNALLDRLRQELGEYFAGRRRAFDLPLNAPGTPFQEKVWRALLAIPYGEVRSYADIARSVDSPLAVRAVGRANGMNRIAIVIPCHRVVGKDGTLVGYGGGMRTKEYLLDLERGVRSPVQLGLPVAPPERRLTR